MMKFSIKEMMQWAWSLTNGHRIQLALYMFLELVAICLSMLFIFWTKEAMDTAMSHRDKLQLEYLLTCIAVAVIVGIIIRAVGNWINERVRLQMHWQLKEQLIERQMLTVWNTAKRWHSGDVQLRVLSESKEVVDTIAYASPAFLLTLIRLIASFGFLWFMDPMLAIIVVAISPLFLFSKLYFRKMGRLNKEVKEEESTFGKLLQENLRFRMLVRAMNMLGLRRSKLERTLEKIYRFNMAQLNFSTLSQAILKLTINCGYLITFFWGIYRLHAGEISFGTMTAFLQLVSRIQSPIIMLIGYVPTFARFRVSAERLMELDYSQQEVQETPYKIDDLESIEMKDVYFRYEDHWIINGVCFLASKGLPLALLGTSGKGKTTLIRLLLTLLKPENGSIVIRRENGDRQMLSAKHRVNMAYVPQGNSLFAGTIRENLQLGSAMWDEKKVEKALHTACAEFVYNFPEGLDTNLGEIGVGLSEGQAQRIAIARAIMCDCTIWIFDEITSALDRNTADELTRRLLKEGKDKVCIFVTHDLNLAEKCSQIIYLK